VATADLRQIAPRPLNAGLRTDKLVGLIERPAPTLDEAIDRFIERKGAAVPTSGRA
jgi:hypothetical protein